MLHPQNLTELPEEILLKILSLLHPTDLLKINRVNKLFHALSKDESLKISLAASGDISSFASLELSNQRKALQIAILSQNFKGINNLLDFLDKSSLNYLLIEAATYNELKIIQAIFDKSNLLNLIKKTTFKLALEKTAQLDHEPIISFLLTHPHSKPFLDVKAFFHFVVTTNEGGQLLEWLVQNYPILNEEDTLLRAFVSAASQGKLTSAQWLYEHIQDSLLFSAYSESALNLAKTNGHNHIVEWLEELKSLVNPSSIFSPQYQDFMILDNCDTEQNNVQPQFKEFSNPFNGFI